MQTQLEHLSIDTLIPYARNSRTHSPEQIALVAASIREFGFTNPVLIDGQGGIIAGHGRVMAARQIGLAAVPCLRLAHLSDAQKRAYVIADNKLALNAGWDEELLALELKELDALGFDLSLTGFVGKEIDDLLADLDGDGAGQGDADAVPEPQAAAISKTGDVWILGRHRVMCGDSISDADVARLMNGQRAALLHADPPYGMGKEGDGVANDNLYREKLDAFQMQWWRAFRSNIEDNASVYIWGNAPDLWRLWWAGGLGISEKLHLCNHITWDKKSIPGMASDLMLQFPIASEHCLFFKIGEQFVGNVNADQYFEGWDVIRSYLEEQAAAAGLTPARTQELTGVGMYSHWFSKSQWNLIPQKHYETLQRECAGFFTKPYRDIRKQYDEIKGGYRNHLNGIQGGMRSYFDNAHDVMRDVWEFSRVTGDERHGHATPKPIAMMARVMKSSLPAGGLCVEPFGGSGSTLIGAESTGRACYTMELKPIYVDVIVRRWQEFTGQRAIHAETGDPFPG